MQLDETSMQYALERIELHKRLTKDLQAILSGAKPTPAELDAAPLLDNYQFVTRAVPAAVGFGTGHPTLPRGSIKTSQIYVLDPDHRWIRTLSRFYRLGTRRVRRDDSDPMED